MSPSGTAPAAVQQSEQQQTPQGSSRRAGNSHRRRSLTSLAALTAAAAAFPLASAFVPPTSLGSASSSSSSSSSMLARHYSRRVAGALHAFLLPASSPLSTAPAASRIPHTANANGAPAAAFKRGAALKASYRGGGGGGGGRGGYRGGGGGRGRPAPVDDFSSFGEQMAFDTTVNADDANLSLIAEKRVSPEVVEALAAHNITTFTAIQQATYDPLYDGRDMIGRSRTGTGKTLAFGLPILELVAKNLAEEGTKNARGRAPAVIIFAPTRELDKQCDEQLSRIGRPLGACNGGAVMVMVMVVV
jgi:hypothetical protein